MDIPLLVLIVIVTALAFDFTNGFHDTANAMATSIATGALKPKVAVAVAAVLNLVGAFLSTEVAKTISGGLVDDTKITTAVIFGGLTGAIVWNMLTWLLGIPSSSSMALFGGLIGAVWIGSGANAVHFGAVISKVLIPAFASPVVAALVTAAATYLAYRIVRSANGASVSRGFRVGQTVSASMVSLAHGTSDGQKTMGVITLTLIAAGQLHQGSGPPLWVVFSAGTAIAIGTYLGGWRIIQTMGHKLVRIEAPRVSPLKPPLRWCCWCPRMPGSRSRPRRYAPAASWVPDWARTANRCAGQWPGECCLPGASPCPPRESSAA